ncbi:MAG: hypothetical protein V4692_11025 [Bdellovibrionota bacterium]
MAEPMMGLKVKPKFRAIILSLAFMNLAAACQSSKTSTNPPTGAPGAPRAVVSQVPALRMKSGQEKKEDISARALTSSGVNSSPAFSPDGGKILFVSKNRSSHKHSQIYELDIVRMTERRLTFHDGDDAAPAWSGANEFIYSSSTDRIKEEPAMIARLKSAYLGGAKFEPAFPGDLFRQRSDGREIKRITQSAGLDQDANKDPASNKIIFARVDGGSRLNVLEGERLKILSSKDVNDHQPSFSKDGKQIAFVRAIDDKRAQIFVSKGLDLKSARALTSDKHLSRDPAWHPTQDAILFSSNLGGNVFDLYVFDLKLDCLMRITIANQNLSEPTFSPDGENIVFSSEISGSKHLFMMDYNHGQVSCLRTEG